ncbi:MAG: hypothetical protein V3S46_09910 [Nitrospinota bacterium]
MKAGWGGRSKFYLPNEDARIVCEAVRHLDKRPNNPLFVCGSGMVALMVMSELEGGATGTVVDVSSFQLDYFKSLLEVIGRSENAEALLGWFKKTVYPELCAHFERRGKSYPLESVIGAMKNLFGIDFFYNNEVFLKIKSRIGSISTHKNDLNAYLQQIDARHDFIYLSNVVDHMDEEEFRGLFDSCRRLDAFAYLLITDACKEGEAVKKAWTEAGYTVHPFSAGLTKKNRGLGSASLVRDWNRKGNIYLLSPC